MDLGAIVGVIIAGFTIQLVGLIVLGARIEGRTTTKLEIHDKVIEHLQDHVVYQDVCKANRRAICAKLDVIDE